MLHNGTIMVPNVVPILCICDVVSRYSRNINISTFWCMLCTYVYTRIWSIYTPPSGTPSDYHRGEPVLHTTSPEEEEMVHGCHQKRPKYLQMHKMQFTMKHQNFRILRISRYGISALLGYPIWDHLEDHLEHPTEDPWVLPPLCGRGSYHECEDVVDPYVSPE